MNTEKEQYQSKKITIEELNHIPEKHGVYCFIDDEHGKVYANATNNIKKGLVRHVEKLTTQKRHRVPELFKSFHDGKITIKYYDTENYDTASLIMEHLKDTSDYEVISL